MADQNNQETDFSKTAASAVTEKRRRFIKPLTIIAVICAVVFAVLFYTAVIGRPYDKTHNSYSKVKIAEGSDIDVVAKQLQEEEIVGSASNFKRISKMLFLTDFKPGTYYLSPSMDSRTIARTLVKGITTSNGFTIPDGYTVKQVASELARDGFVDKKKFLKAASSSIFSDIDFIGNEFSGTDQIEGFLFPGSYTISSDADESMIIITMIDSFSNFFNDEYRARADEMGMSIRDVIIVASLIEKETAIDKEKPLISSVLHNRFNLDMLSKKDIPEVPLCSPGKDSIIAALYPEDTEYTYYVHSDKLDGSHVFTDDEEEYKELKKAYSEAMKEKRKAREASSIEGSAQEAGGEE